MSDDHDWEMEADEDYCRDLFGENLYNKKKSFNHRDNAPSISNMDYPRTQSPMQSFIGLRCPLNAEEMEKVDSALDYAAYDSDGDYYFFDPENTLKEMKEAREAGYDFYDFMIGVFEKALQLVPNCAILLVYYKPEE